jgi:hypothetical protein
MWKFKEIERWSCAQQSQNLEINQRYLHYLRDINSKFERWNW